MATTEELARRLLAAGISVDTADMFEEDGHVSRMPRGGTYVTSATIMAESWRFVRPGWSMEA